MKRVWYRRLLLALGLCLVVCLGWIVPAYIVPLPERLSSKDGVVVTWADGRPAHVFLSPDEKWRFEARLESVDPRYVEALIAFEDQRFWSHPGVDVFAIGRAVLANLSHGRRVSGASTLTMQLVRLLEPRPRTYVSKFVEAWRATQLEVRLSKEEILENYLRFIPMGRNIEGVHAGSLAYFGREANLLSYDEIAVLLAVPQSPNVRFPDAANVERLRTARDRIAQHLHELGALKDDGVDSTHVLAMIHEADVPDRLRAFPREIPHTAYSLRASRGELRISTSLDSGIQRVAENLLAPFQEPAALQGIDHATVLVVDHQAQRVVAAVGNFDFGDKPGMQIAAYNVPRSTGSLLKPFIFAMSVEEGLAHPRNLVQDVPGQFGNYRPENYDGTFKGLVRYDEALSLSLNMPFIQMLYRLGVEPFVTRLRLAGIPRLVTEPGYYGLSAAVGGIEMRPLDVASLYAALANDGLGSPLKVTPGQSVPERYFSAESSYLTRQALRLRDRPDFDRRRANHLAARFFWKTGTSFGNRDAWAVGAGAKYTVVVWMGNLDRRPSSALVGSERCGPVLFDLLQALEPQVGADRSPAGMTQVEVCAYSGFVPGDACSERIMVEAPANAVVTQVCPFHQFRHVDTKTGLALTPECRAGRQVVTKPFLVWPASVRRLMSPGAVAMPLAPEFAPECASSESSLRIVSPRVGQNIRLMAGVDVERQKVPLEAEARDGRSMLHWFVDGIWLGTVPATERLWWVPEEGEHEILVQDDRGFAQKRSIRVNTSRQTDDGG